MSGFGDSFKKGGEGGGGTGGGEENELEYDDSAFYFFSMALLTCITIPFVYLTLQMAIQGEFPILHEAKNCQTRDMKDIIARRSKENRAKIWTPAFYVRIMIMLSLMYLTFLNFNKVMSIEMIGKFDPYDILEISSDATMKEIKSRYRKLSLTKHPDKNPDDPLAV